MGVNSCLNPSVFIHTSLDGSFGRDHHVHNIHIGRHTSIAMDVDFCVGSNHDYKALSMTLFSPPAHRTILPPNKGQILIQNDVWIGHGATIMPGVTVHNGAVIAANSHVVKDVPAYSMVGGNPAKVIKYRFNKEIIRKLQMIKWWDWPTELRESRKEDIATYDVRAFCDKYYDQALEDFNQVPVAPCRALTANKKVYLYFMDDSPEWALWKKVIHDFATLHNGGMDVLVLAGVRADKERIEAFVRDAAYDVPILYVDKSNDERSLMACADFYIANRDDRTVLRSEYADDYSVKILSAVDSCGF